jgi:hypothetical protein
VRNPTVWDRMLFVLRQRVIALLRAAFAGGTREFAA